MSALIQDIGPNDSKFEKMGVRDEEDHGKLLKHLDEAISAMQAQHIDWILTADADEIIGWARDMDEAEEEQ